MSTVRKKCKSIVKSILLDKYLIEFVDKGSYTLNEMLDENVQRDL